MNEAELVRRDYVDDLLEKTGRSFFVRNYYDLKNRQKCCDGLSKASSKIRLSAANALFRNELNIEALMVIAASDTLPQYVLREAHRLIIIETGELFNG